MTSPAFVLLAALVAYAAAQCTGPNGDTINACPDGTCPTGPPPDGCSGTGGGTGTGDTTSTECTITTGNCALDGSSNNMYRHLTYSSTTGKFTGTVVTNGCPDHTHVNQNTPSCIEITIPDPAYTSGPSAAPLLGRVGVVLSGGTNIYGPFEAGFQTGFACSADDSDCVAGLDVATCEAEIEFECSGTVLTQLFMDTCGGHATPYHHHQDPVCKYDKTAPGHSPLIGVALDGYGIYGVWEGSNEQRPCMDACHGHTDVVPGGDSFGLTTSSTVYHYHTYDGTEYPAIWTLGCFGPVASKAECLSLYPECGDDSTTVYTVDYPNGLVVDLFCGCYDSPSCTSTIDPSVSPSVSASPSVSPSPAVVPESTTPSPSPSPSASLLPEGCSMDPAIKLKVFSLLANAVVCTK